MERGTLHGKKLVNSYFLHRYLLLNSHLAVCSGTTILPKIFSRRDWCCHLNTEPLGGHWSLPPLTWPWLSMREKPQWPFINYLLRANYWARFFNIISSKLGFVCPFYMSGNCQDSSKNRIVKHVSFHLEVTKTSGRFFCILKLKRCIKC